MTVLTTLSFSRIESQLAAVKSWQDLGYSIYSINSKSDIDELSKIFDIEFIETDLIGSEFGKDYIRLNAFTDWIKQNGDALIINSDIEIFTDINLQSLKGLTIFSRNDYSYSITECKKFRSGFDAFYVTTEVANLIPKSKLVIGQCHWDYYLPLIAIKNRIQLFSPTLRNMYHKEHSVQYDRSKWLKTAKIFSDELHLSGNPVNDSNISHRTILNNIKYY